ncbi:MAG: peptidoglycan -binding protein [Alphaproteobacteria bacterium]|nr:peptidoglycan -binding protein [Alphaproteobacteria bacterium]
MALRGRRSAYTIDPWAGWVDALSTLLIVFIFLLVVFSLAQISLTQILSGRNEALAELQSQVDELADLLALDRQANADLRLNVAQLSSELQRSVATRDDLSAQLSAAITARETAVEELARARDDLAERAQEVASTEADLTLKLSEIESLRRDIAALEDLRRQLESEVTKLAVGLEDSKDQLALLTADTASLRDRSKELEARMADAEERTMLAQTEIEQREIRLSELVDLLALADRDLKDERTLSAEAQTQVALLNQQIAALREQLAALSEALDLVKVEAEDKDIQIADLGRKLNLALASKVQELERYRSEFFGRLREVLGEHPDVRIEGDRFVFQSEVLFASGSADLGAEGKTQLGAIAATLLEIAATIPTDLHWILRVDGHTDIVPINNLLYPSNWELSTARAISVVRFLISQGVPANRLVAAGFGEFQPMDARDDEIGRRRNRRIELKLDQR